MAKKPNGYTAEDIEILEDLSPILHRPGMYTDPVNPNHATVMGLTCYPSLEAIPGPVDVVDVFRRPEHCADVVRAAVTAGAKGVWLQSGIVSRDAERLAREAGIDFVQDRCMKVDHMFQGQ